MEKAGNVSNGSLDMSKRAIKVFEQVCLHDLVWPDLFEALNMDIFVSSCSGGINHITDMQSISLSLYLKI